MTHYPELLQLPVVSLTDGTPDHLQSLTLVGGVVVEVVLAEHPGLWVGVGLVVLPQPEVVGLHLLMLGCHCKS
jgi:hypothetical protein